MIKNIVAKATIKNLKVTPQKLNLVAGLIRRKKADDALLQLKFSKRRIAFDVYKCLKSAIANAENISQISDVLFVNEVLVGKSICMKRFRARARGKSTRIHKFFSNLTITLNTYEGEKSEVVLNSSEINSPVKAEAKSPVKAEAKSPVKAEAKGPVKAEAKGPVKAEAKGPVKAEAKSPVKAEAKGPVKAETKSPVKAEAKAQDKSIRSDEKVALIKKDKKSKRSVDQKSSNSNVNTKVS